MDAKMKNHPGFIAFKGSSVAKSDSETQKEKQKDDKTEIVQDKKYSEASGGEKGEG